MKKKCEWKKSLFIKRKRILQKKIKKNLFFCPRLTRQNRRYVMTVKTTTTPRTYSIKLSVVLISLVIPTCLSVDDLAGSRKACLAVVETVLEHNSPELLVIPNEDELSIFTSNRVHISVTWVGTFLRLLPFKPRCHLPLMHFCFLHCGEFWKYLPWLQKPR